jgi:hypothetical protein
MTEEQRRFESIIPSWGSLTTRHMQDSNLHISTFIRILQNMTGSSAIESTVHLQSSSWLRGYTLLSPSLHSQCAVSRLHDRITEILGLPEHVVSCKVSTHTIQSMVWSLIDTCENTKLRLLSQCKLPVRSQFIIIHSFSCSTTTLQTLLNIFKVFSLSKAKHTKYFQIKH